ncbi:MAG: tetratricopeptide repeat protein [Saprospiraceae bacterium]|nr:tetratricopeptide repeat protein [Saprospiraceae bacterium]
MTPKTLPPRLFYLISRLALLICCNLLSSAIAISQHSNLTAIDSLVKEIEKSNDKKLNAERLNFISFTYTDYDPKLGLQYGQKALDMAKDAGSDKELARAYNNMAINFLMLSDYFPCEENFEKALSVYKEMNDEKGIADVLGNLGVLSESKGDYDAALNYQFQALKSFEKLNHTVGMANTYNNIGSLYMNQKSYKKAIIYDSLALKNFILAKDENGVASVLGNLANIYEEQHESGKAIDNYNKAIAIYKNLGIKWGVARNMNNLATSYMRQYNYKKALLYFQEANILFEEFDYPTGIVYILGNVGVSYLRSHGFLSRKDSFPNIIDGSESFLLGNALEYLEQAVDLAKKIGEHEPLADFAEALSDAYEKSGNPSKALEYHKLFTSTRDSIHSIESKIQIEQLTTQREVELKEKQIELDRLAVLKKRNERVYFIIGMLLLALALALIYRNYANQKKSNIELTFLNNQIAETNVDLEDKNVRLWQTLKELKETQSQLIETEKQKEKAIIRGRISQDIHDDISSGLTKISWLAELLKTKAAPNAEKSELGLIEKINANARDVVSKLGEIIWSSNPERDNLESLLSYIRSYVSSYMEDVPIRYQVDFPDDLPNETINPELRRNLFLVLKEALHNAIKYSEAQLVSITFHHTGDTYQLEVADNGRGMAEGIVHGGGNGMVNMRRRMETVGGKIDVETGVGMGTRMKFTGTLYH